MNPEGLLAQFLGPDMGQRVGGAVQVGKEKLAGSGLAGVAGGVAAGGLLGILLGSKKARKSAGRIAGGVVGYGGAAALGALAYRAYQNWQSGRPAPRNTHQNAGHNVPAAQPLGAVPAESKFLPAAAPGSNGRPFELAMVMAMIAAANADGHIGPDEQKSIFERVGELPLDAEDKAFVFDALATPPSLQDIASLAGGPEQAAELYLVSRLAIDPDHPMEQAYLEALASRLSLPRELVDHLESQVAAQAATV